MEIQKLADLLNETLEMLPKDRICPNDDDIEGNGDEEERVKWLDD